MWRIGYSVSPSFKYLKFRLGMWRISMKNRIANSDGCLFLKPKIKIKNVEIFIIPHYVFVTIY